MFSDIGKCKHGPPYLRLLPPDDFDSVAAEYYFLDQGGEELVDANGVAVLNGVGKFMDDALQSAHAFLPFVPDGFLAHNALYFGLNAV